MRSFTGATRRCWRSCSAGPANNSVTAELNRIASKNSDINVNVGGRSIMLRIPFSFDLIALDRFKNAAELYKLSLPAAKKR